MHRSGRTARANQTGTTVSLVSPEDAAHHRAICAYLGVGKGLPLLQVDLYCLPMLRQRVALAKQVRTQGIVRCVSIYPRIELVFLYHGYSEVSPS